MLVRGWLRSRRVDVAWAVGVAALAFAVPLAVDLRSAGLHGRIGYDGSVYYASAVALAHGVLPYRDFLLLHPPGIVLALLPFAALGAVVGDPAAVALARLAWFGLGAVGAVLVLIVLRGRGRWPAVLGAAAYAVSVPAVVSEHTTSLEGLGSVCLLGAVALLTVGRDRRTGPVWPLVAAGALVGFSTGTKIWGAAVVLTLVAWSAARLGVRRAALVLAGAVGATVVVCLPFFVTAPGAMWRMVVLDQLGRPRVGVGLAGRVVDVAGWSGLRGTVGTGVLACAAVGLAVAALLLAVHDPVGRLAALLLVVTTAVLLATPPWSVAYTGLAAPAVALVAGSAVARLADRGRPLRAAVGVLAVAGVVGVAAVSLPGLHPGSRFPGAALERVLVQVPGCVTTDDPVALVETGAMRRDLALGCPVVVDPSGYSYDLRPGADRHVGRAANPQWQAFLTHHLASGRLTVVVRFQTAPGLSRTTRRTVGRWPVVATVGAYAVRRPTSDASRPTG